MACILIIGLNLAGLRASILGRDEALPIVGVVLGGLLQFAAYRGFQRSGRARHFWLGFASIGTIATVSLFWAVHHQESIVARLWIPYIRGMIDFVETLKAVVIRLVGNATWGNAFVVLVSIGAILPVVLLAYAGGTLVRRIQGGLGRRSNAAAETLVH